MKNRLRDTWRYVVTVNRRIMTVGVLVPVFVLSGFVGVAMKQHPHAAISVPGENYQICGAQSAQYLTSPWTYHALASGTQDYTAAQYQALPGYGTTLPPLPSYILNEPGSPTAARIFAPGSTASSPAYASPETPIIYFFEGGAYPSGIGFQSVSGDEFIGGSASGFPEPAFDDHGGAAGIDAGNDTFHFTGAETTVASTATAGTNTVTVSGNLGQYLNWIAFPDGSYYSIASQNGNTYTLGSNLTSTESAGTKVWGNNQGRIAQVASAAAQGATSLTLTGSTIPMMQYSTIVIGADTYQLSSVSGSQSGYTVGIAQGLDYPVTAGTPVWFGTNAGNVTVSYLDINNDQHNTTGTIYTGSGWTVTHNNVHDGYSGGPGQGVAIYGGDNSTIEYNCLSKMGDYGINVFGSNNKFDYNEIFDSNYQPDPGCGCSGGGKWWGTLNADIVDNAFIDDGPAGGTPLWLDNGNSGTLISGNYFDKSPAAAISSETGFNLNITGNLFQDNNWGSGSGSGNINQLGAINMNSSGGFHVPNSRYDNQVNITGNYFINNWGGVTVWQSGGRSCENSGEGWPYDAGYCSGGFPNTSVTSVGGQYYFSHYQDSSNGWGTHVAQDAPAGSSTILVAGSVAANDQIGINDPAKTTTSSTTNVASLSNSTINAASTAGFPTSGQLRVGTSAAWDGNGSWTGAILSYTGTTATSFTGVNLVRGKGTLAGPVWGVQPYKATAETCYANTCKVSITPSLTSPVSAGNSLTNAGTCQLYATSVATPTSPLAPDGDSYFDGCQWGTRNITVSGNSFSTDPSYINSQTALGGGTTNCTAGNFCGTNSMVYQEAGEPPFDTFIGGNAMMSRSSLTGCPSWDSGCTSNPLKNLNALSNAVQAPAANNEPPENDAWSNNSYYGTWGWYAYWYGLCAYVPTDPTTNKTMPNSPDACNNVDFSHWQSVWQQDSNSTFSATPNSNPPLPGNKTGDFNSDGNVNITDLSMLLSAWGTNNSGILTNLGQSGTVNITCLSIFLSHWGT